MDKDYKKLYEEALERAKIFKSPYCQHAAEVIFPELRESEDEIMKEVIHNLIVSNDCTASSKEIFSVYGKTKEDCLAWLEKQGEQKSADEVKPNHWKPSEEQLRVLQIAIRDYGICVEKNVLESLYNDLKKL